MEEVAYKVGALLYMPATKKNAAQVVLEAKYPGLSSIAFCLEDAIADSMLESAESQLLITLGEIAKQARPSEAIPMLFVRVRNPEHLESFAFKMKARGLKVTGFILPKFDMSNAKSYLQAARELNGVWLSSPFVMPILESAAIASPVTRLRELTEIKNLLDHHKDMVLNIRVGGNDLSGYFGLRRSCNQNIYQLGVVRDALVDILGVFAKDYVVSGPVWEYFESNNDLIWKDGLEAELKLDKANGFIGKTAIHPSQIQVINESCKVSQGDFEDAKCILAWDHEDAVAKSPTSDRMDEVKTHERWARRIICLANAFGVVDG